MLIIGIVLVMALSSCKKNYTCTCIITTITTINSNSGTSAPTTTISTTSSSTISSVTTFNNTKSKAEKQCSALSKSNVTPPVNCVID